jgi:hypothetical protein
MAIVTGLKAERMLAIEAESVNSGVVDSDGDLILTRHDGTQINAGHVKGETGDDAVAYFQVNDSPTVDLTMVGNGTQASPWTFQADVITPAVEKTKLRILSYDAASTGWFVKGDDGVTYGPYQAAQSYFPGRGDIVWVKRNGFGSYVIEGYLPQWRPITGSGSTVKSYNDITADNQWNYLEYQVVNGFATIRGLGTLTVAGNVGGQPQLIGILPPEARPENTIIVKSNNSDVIRALYIYASTGEIRASATATANGFYSLDGVTFPVKGKAVWTYVGDPGSGLAWANGWGHFGGGTTDFGKVGFWRDEFDYIWTTGLASGGTISALTPMITITNPLFTPWDGTPSPSSLGGEQYMMTTCAEVGGIIDVVGGTAPSIRAATIPSASWVSFGGLHYLSTAAHASSEWIEHPTPRGIRNGWVWYGAGYPTFAFRQRSDGMMTVKGMLKSGTLGTLDWIPDGFRSERSHLMCNAANGNYCRFDIAGRQSTSTPGAPGQINTISGSNAWYSLDGGHWFR